MDNKQAKIKSEVKCFIRDCRVAESLSTKELSNRLGYKSDLISGYESCVPVPCSEFLNIIRSMDSTGDKLAEFQIRLLNITNNFIK